jgi:hypothetical protein
MNIFNNYYSSDIITDISNLKISNINIIFFDNIIKQNGFQYGFHLIKDNENYINIKLTKKMIFKIDIIEDDIFIILNKNETKLIEKLKEIDNYFQTKSEFIDYKYIPILRYNNNNYIKCKLLLDYQSNNILTDFKVQDSFTDEIFQDNLDSFDNFKKEKKNIKELILFPNKLWKCESEKKFGISLRIKDIIVIH